MLEEKLYNLNPTFNGHYNLFNNHREQGLQLVLYVDKNVENDLCIWSCMCRNSDQIMVIIANGNCSDLNSNFSDNALKSAKYFDCNDYNSATEYTLNVLKKNFPRHLNGNYNYKFNCFRNLSDLEKIIADAENLDYEDYYDLATFEEDKYFCDLVIYKGKVGLRYSYYLNNERNEFENVCFKVFQPDLSSDVTLMLGMKEKLKDFIDNEIEYEINYGSNNLKM